MLSMRALGNRLSRGGAKCSAAVFLWVLWAAASPAAVDGPLAGGSRNILGIRHFTSPEHTRIVLDMSGPVSFEVRRVADPDRIAINISGAEAGQVGPVDVGDGLVRRVRVNARPQRAQVVLDLAERSEFRSFSLAATGGRPDRIVVDVLRAPGRENAAPAVAAAGEAEAVAAAIEARPFVVVIDPGHGGLDPGACRNGLAEKTVVLDIAREMARLINAVPGYRAHLTRTGDYGLELWQRVDKARELDGDLFLSVHCNTHSREEVDGMEVYFLSLQGATDREAMELADKENAAQLVGLDPGVPHDELVMDILMDLKMTQVLRESARLSHQLLDSCRASGLVKGRKVKQARFQVLRSLAMPSALIEAAYMSNPDDFAVLADRKGRKDLAATVVQGVLAWRQDQPALLQLAGNDGPGWTRSYQVRRGDSLWGIARRHGTTVTEISRYNDLPSGAINVGQVLRLPEAVREP